LIHIRIVTKNGISVNENKTFSKPARRAAALLRGTITEIARCIVAAQTKNEATNAVTS
jgi:hypothetical protein